MYPDNGILFKAKINKLSNREKTGRSLEFICLSERNQSERATYI